jgi:hypothetical protein
MSPFSLVIFIDIALTPLDSGICPQNHRLPPFHTPHSFPPWINNTCDTHILGNKDTHYIPSPVFSEFIHSLRSRNSSTVVSTCTNLLSYTLYILGPESPIQSFTLSPVVSRISSIVPILRVVFSGPSIPSADLQAISTIIPSVFSFPRSISDHYCQIFSTSRSFHRTYPIIVRLIEFMIKFADLRLSVCLSRGLASEAS